MDAPVIVETFSNPFDMESMCGENGRCGKPAGFSEQPFFGNDFPIGSHQSWRSASPGREFSTTTTTEIPQNHNQETIPESRTSPSQQQNPEMANNVRIIPIHVEGYDEPVMPSNEHFSARQAPKSGRHPSKDEAQDKAEKSHQTTQPSQPRSASPPQTRSTPPSQIQPPSEAQHPTPPSQKLGPIDQIKSIQSSVLQLMGEMERFNGKPKDKQYCYLDEMLTRNLLKLDNVETDGKDTIRQARREAVKCIQQCLDILEAKAKANKELEDQQLEIDRLVENFGKSETEKSDEGNACTSMEVDIEAKSSGDVETKTEKDESGKDTESKKDEVESMDTTSEVSNNLETVSIKDNQVAENKEASSKV